MSMLGEHALLCYLEWLKWVSKIADVTIRDVKGFVDIPQMLANSGIYRKWDKVKDEIGQLQLKTDRPLTLIFGWAHIDGKWKHFPNSVLAQFTIDGVKKYREFPLLTDKYMADLNDTRTGHMFSNVFIKPNIVKYIWGGKYSLQA